MRGQRITGAVLILAGLLFLLLATLGELPEERDITMTVALVPAGICLMVTKKQYIPEGGNADDGDEETTGIQQLGADRPGAPGAVGD